MWRQAHERLRCLSYGPARQAARASFSELPVLVGAGVRYLRQAFNHGSIRTCALAQRRPVGPAVHACRALTAPSAPSSQAPSLRVGRSISLPSLMPQPFTGHPLLQAQAVSLYTPSRRVFPILSTPGFGRDTSKTIAKGSTLKSLFRLSSL